MRKDQNVSDNLPFIKPSLDEAVERLRRFWAREMRDEICVTVSVGKPSTDARQVRQRPAEVVPCPDLKAMFHEMAAHMERYRDMGDDAIPAMSIPAIDQGLFGAALGAEVVFLRCPDGGVSSMSKPLIHDWSQLARLRFSLDNPWIRLLRETCEHYQQHTRGRWGLGTLITIDGLNFVCELRGATNAYLDLYEHPAEVRQLMDFALDMNIQVAELQRGIFGTYRGGVLGTYYWSPNRTVSISVDCYAMCHSRVYRELGEPFLQRLVDHFGGGMLHVHHNGRHLLPALQRLRGLMGIKLADDWSPERAFLRLDEMRRLAGDVPLMVSCGYNEFLAALEAKRLLGNFMYHVSGAPDHDAAQRLVDRAKQYQGR